MRRSDLLDFFFLMVQELIKQLVMMLFSITRILLHYISFL